MRFQIDIFEGRSKTPTLTHIFHGRTESEIDGLILAHRQTDRFLNAALTTGNFEGIPLRVLSAWV